MIDCAPPGACALPKTAAEMLERERELSAHVEALTLSKNRSGSVLHRACSSARAVERKQPGRLRRLLKMHHPLSPAQKCKASMTDIIQANAVLRRAIFGRLNTYQYSLIFLMKRLFRLNDLALTEEILRLLASNPYRDDASKPYESRWSLVF